MGRHAISQDLINKEQQQQQPESSSRVLINPTFPGSCIWAHVGVTWSLVSWSMAGLDSKAKWKGREIIPLPRVALPQGISETSLCRTCLCQPPSFAGAWLCESSRSKFMCHLSIPNNYCLLHRQRRGGKYFMLQYAPGSCSSLTFFIREEVSAAQSLKKEQGTILDVPKWIFPPRSCALMGKGEQKLMALQFSSLSHSAAVVPWPGVPRPVGWHKGQNVKR